MKVCKRFQGVFCLDLELLEDQDRVLKILSSLCSNSLRSNLTSFELVVKILYKILKPVDVFKCPG